MLEAVHVLYSVVLLRGREIERKLLVSDVLRRTPYSWVVKEVAKVRNRDVAVAVNVELGEGIAHTL